jgi:ABC-type transporter Mla subunit MlaD
MNNLVICAIVLLVLAFLLIVLTFFFGWLKKLQRNRFKSWTFLDYVSVGYAKHLFVKYIKRQ